MRIPRLLVALMTAVAILSLGGVVSAQNNLSRLKPTHRSLSLQAKNVTVTDAMHLLSEASGIEIRLEPEVAALKTEINATFNNVTFADVFKMLVETQHLGYSVIDEKTVLVTAAP